MANKMTILLSPHDVDYLQMLINADMKSRIDQQIHAQSHGSDYEDAQISDSNSILQRLGRGH